jgi:DNA-directed RNA polymerase beta' subunit
MLYRTKKDLENIANVIYSIVDQKREKLSIVYFPMNENNEFIMDVWVKPSIEEIEQIIKMITKKKKSLIVTDKVRERLNEIVNDDNKMLKYVENIIVNILKKLPISGIFGIEECYYSEDKKKEWHIDTKGSNLEQLVYHPYIDYKRTRSNNMYDILKLFGIEATNKFLYEEFSKIISVNKRHLDMLINSMTANGSIMSVNRYGIDRKQVGPLAKACFEQPVDNFMYSATKGEIDPLRGVSSIVCVGKLNKVGTGMVDLFIDMKKTDKYYNELYKDNKEEVTEEQDENEYIDDVEFY